MIGHDPKNCIGILLDFPRSPVFRTLRFRVRHAVRIVGVMSTGKFTELAM